MIELSFLGGTGTVTGSKYLLSWRGKRIMIDCGLFQGLKKLRQKNWHSLEVDPATIDAVVLTHAHLDHSGYLPLLVKNGFSGSVFCSAPTKDLCEILLKDSAFLQEKDAELANRYHYSKHKPALPLYNQRDAEVALSAFRVLDLNDPQELVDGIGVEILCAGHILGASMVRITLDGNSLLFSGDLGRPDDPIMPAPAPLPRSDYLIVESTYGDRKHETGDVEEEIAAIVSSTARRGGKVIVPAFAVGRTQTLLYHLDRLKKSGRIPDLPVFLDSPMAINASNLYCKHTAYHKLGEAECRAACDVARYVRKAEDSKALAFLKVPAIIISASGMASGGRILHHLKHFVSDHRNTILFTGFQAAGTRGRALVDGVDNVKLHGLTIPVRATVMNLSALSAHADSEEIIQWLKKNHKAPSITFVTHGEPNASTAMANRISNDLGWDCSVPNLGSRIDL